MITTETIRAAFKDGCISAGTRIKTAKRQTHAEEPGLHCTNHLKAGDKIFLNSWLARRSCLAQKHTKQVQNKAEWLCETRKDEDGCGAGVREGPERGRWHGDQYEHWEAARKSEGGLWVCWYCRLWLWQKSTTVSSTASSFSIICCCCLLQKQVCTVSAGKGASEASVLCHAVNIQGLKHFRVMHVQFQLFHEPKILCGVKLNTV